MHAVNGRNGTINGYKNEALNIAVVGGGLVSKRFYSQVQNNNFIKKACSFV